jgi:uncharacterized protein
MVDMSKVVVIGRSLGSAVASYFCTKLKVKALVLLSPIGSTGRIAEVQYGKIAKFIIKDRFDNISMASKITSPTLIIHGNNDEIVPVSQVEMIHGTTIVIR